MTSLEMKLCLKSVILENGCIAWTGKYNRGGYGVMWWDGKQRLVHRLALKAHLGRDIRPGMWSLHRCNNKFCLNVEHLYEGTPSQNNLDQWNAGNRYKLTPAIRAQLMSLARAGMNIPKLCARFGVARNYVADRNYRMRIRNAAALEA